MKEKKFSILCCALAAAFAAASAHAGASDVQCETVIVGAGGAGMRTAIALKEAGRDVILVEKLAFAGGATNLAATYMTVVGTKEQAAAGKVLSLDDYVARQKKINPNMNEKRIREVRGASQETLDWINALGANITRAISDYQVGTADGRSLGSTIVKAMKSKLDAVGVVPRYETRAVALLGDKTRVTGIVVKDKTGEYKISAKNVVLATGGYAAGQEAIGKYAPQWKGLPSTSSPGATGDAIAMVEPFGASLKFMDVVRMNPSVYSANGRNLSLSAARAEGGIMVNSDGKRFCNDYYTDYTQLSRWMMEQKGSIAFIVIDDKAMQKSKRLQGFKKQGVLLQSDTIEGLAEKMGVPAANLKETLVTYGGYVRDGVDKQFGRKHNMSIDFTTPPFYAAQTHPGIQVTLGGIEVNDDMQVLNKQGKVIEGLYAVGEVAHDGLFGTGPTAINIYYGKKVADHILKTTR